MKRLTVTTLKGSIDETNSINARHWDNTPFLTSRSTVLGALANCAVRQLFPIDLAQALSSFDSKFTGSDYFETDCTNLRRCVRSAFNMCPIILGWNKPKKSEHTVVFCSRYGQTDFIDLDALARNAAHAVTLEEKYNSLHQ